MTRGNTASRGDLDGLGVLSLSAGDRMRANEGSEELRKGRLLAGMLVATAEKGFASVTVADVVAEARTSRTAFYRHFDSLDRCYLEAFEAASRELRSRLWPLLDTSRGAVDLSDLIGSYLGLLAASPAATRACMVEVYATGSEGVAHRIALQADFVAALREVHRRLREAGQSDLELTDFDLEMIVTSIAGMVTNHVAIHGARTLPSLTEPIVGFAEKALGGGDRRTR